THPQNGSAAASIALLRSLSSVATAQDMAVAICLTEVMANYELGFSATDNLPARASVTQNESASCSGRDYAHWAVGHYELGRLVRVNRSPAAAYISIQADTAGLWERVRLLILLLVV